MTQIYARIASRVVADEYAAVSAKIYGQQPELPVPQCLQQACRPTFVAGQFQVGGQLAGFSEARRRGAGGGDHDTSRAHR
jgi:hypothetical protein